MNNWTNEEKLSMLTSMLRDSEAAISENLFSTNVRDRDKITSALKCSLWRCTVNRVVACLRTKPKA
nr:unnamed protein product [Callosobruchus chinensis]